MHDTWATRELPVLDATVSLLEESYMVTVSDIAARTGLDTAAVARALEALDPDYVDYRKTNSGGDPTFWYVLKVTPQARRAVGQWPTPDSFVTKLSAELSAAAGQEEDAERRTLMSYAARLIGDTLRDVAVRAAGQVLAPSTAATPAPVRPEAFSSPDPSTPAPGSLAPVSSPPEPASPAEEPPVTVTWPDLGHQPGRRDSGEYPAPPFGTEPAPGPEVAGPGENAPQLSAG